MGATITINDAYPWGRSFDEYRRMFSLTGEDLDRRIIGCADGPASFNAGMHRSGRRVVSCDPLYGFSADEIRVRIDETAPKLVELAREAADRFLWDRITSPEHMGHVRRSAMDEFLADYDRGRREGRYVDRSLPELVFADDAFDLALCSHFLLLYSDELSAEFHRSAVLEMCRVAREARIFPLLDMRGQRSRHLDGLIGHLRSTGLRAEIERVDYEFQRGGNEMLRVFRRAAR